ncbi:MAG: hypothetical protein JWR80_6008 [Bradyrhizobium sp.]|nr:hypothetical protein [Bradyrhizobium sp.]
MKNLARFNGYARYGSAPHRRLGAVHRIIGVMPFGLVLKGFGDALPAGPAACMVGAWGYLCGHGRAGTRPAGGRTRRSRRVRLAVRPARLQRYDDVETEGRDCGKVLQEGLDQMGDQEIGPFSRRLIR